MNENPQGTRFRCSKEGCGMEIQVLQPCRSGEDCNLTCCGEKMRKS